MSDDIARRVDEILRRHGHGTTQQTPTTRDTDADTDAQANANADAALRHGTDEAVPKGATVAAETFASPASANAREPHEIHHLPSVLMRHAGDAESDSDGPGITEDPHARQVTDPMTGRVLPDAERIAPIDANPPLRVVVIDNYDSFTYNLVQYLGELGAVVQVHRNDAIDVATLERDPPDAIVISPGPGNPKNERDFGVSGPILLRLSPRIPTLGVCLGLQGFAHLYGGDVTYARAIMHGKTSRCDHDGKGLFAGIPSPITVGRYHSLVAAPDLIPDALEVSATSPDGEIMGLRHRTHPIECVQFHPESILTEHGKRTLANFLHLALRHRNADATTTPSEVNAA